jgi:Bax protein
MKQTILAIIGVFIALVIYTVGTGLSDLAQHNDSECNEKNGAISDNGEESALNIKPGFKGAVNKTPASTPKSKRLFLNKTLAAIKKVKARLDAEYQMVYALSLKESLTHEEEAMIELLKKRYKVNGIPCLLKRLHTHPVSIVMAQAALESGWGSSRFYREANNIFGVWSFNPNEPRMAAGVPREGQKTIYVKKYPNLEASIEGYFRMMAKGNAYKKFRTARLHSDNPFEIISYLNHYSELRHEYVRRLYYMIKSNKFYELDEPSYQPLGWENINLSNNEWLIPKKDDPATRIADRCQKKTKEIIADMPSDTDVNRSQAADITAMPQDRDISVKAMSS